MVENWYNLNPIAVILILSGKFTSRMYRSLRLFSAAAGGVYLSTNISPLKSYNDKSVASALEIEPQARSGRFDGMSLMAGTSGKELTKQLKDILNCPVTSVDTKKYVVVYKYFENMFFILFLIFCCRFSDGETLIIIKDVVRSKHVYVVQTCSVPTSDHIVELLQMVSAARGAGAARITAVIPYFGYKHHRRGLPISSTSQSRFIWSAAFDFAKLLQVMGVDSVVSIDLQHPGQGHEACFFDTQIPVESLYSGKLMAEHFYDHIYKDIEKPNKLVVLATEPQFAKKARSFQKYFKKRMNENVGFGVYLKEEINNRTNKYGVKHNAIIRPAEVMGDVKGCDVVVVDDVVNTGVTISSVCHTLKREGAKRIFICASHGLFTRKLSF